jgi:hypothetical protein
VPASVNVGAFPIETVPKLASMLARTGSADTCGAQAASSKQAKQAKPRKPLLGRNRNFVLHFHTILTKLHRGLRVSAKTLRTWLRRKFVMVLAAIARRPVRRDLNNASIGSVLHR